MRRNHGERGRKHVAMIAVIWMATGAMATVALPCEPPILSQEAVLNRPGRVLFNQETREHFTCHAS